MKGSRKKSDPSRLTLSHDVPVQPDLFAPAPEYKPVIGDLSALDPEQFGYDWLLKTLS